MTKVCSYWGGGTGLTSLDLVELPLGGRTSSGAGRNRWALSVLLLGLLSVAPALSGQIADRALPPPDGSDFLQLSLPKARAAVFFQTWTRAHADLENGRTAEARQGFAAVLALLDELETNPAQRERAILAKSAVHARVLRDRVAAKRELDRALALYPQSSRTLAMEARWKAEEPMPAMAKESFKPQPGPAPGVIGGAEGTP
jgi:hypothetical protein